MTYAFSNESYDTCCILRFHYKRGARPPRVMTWLGPTSCHNLAKELKQPLLCSSCHDLVGAHLASQPSKRTKTATGGLVDWGFLQLLKALGFLYLLPIEIIIL
jgi:hypothetical protein